MKKAILTEKAAVTKAPYSQAIACGDLLFVSGQAPVDPKTGKIVYGGLKEQVRLTLENLKAILEAGGSSLGVIFNNISAYIGRIFKEYFCQYRGNMLK